MFTRNPMRENSRALKGGALTLGPLQLWVRASQDRREVGVELVRLASPEWSRTRDGGTPLPDK
jgi:hypothetical protein